MYVCWSKYKYNLMFLLHINDMLEDANIHCYADDGTVDTIYSGRASFSRKNVEQCRSSVQPREETSVVSPVSLYCQYRDHLDKAKLASRNWRSLIGGDSTLRQNTDWAFIWPRKGLIWRTFLPLDWCTSMSLNRFIAQRTAVQIARDSIICEKLETWGLRRDASSLCVLYRIYHGECSEKLFDLLSIAEFSNRTVRHNAKISTPSGCMRFRRKNISYFISLSRVEIEPASQVHVNSQTPSHCDSLQNVQFKK